MRNEVKIGSLVSVRWLDVTHRDDLTLSQVQKLIPAKAVSHGQLMVLSSDWITIASSEFPGGGTEPDEYRAIVCIPRSVISRIIKLD